ncbi:terminase gpA endonuclease subunit [Rhizobium wenxiniae]|uniref:terminase gpA endonuclease subunit n=1 Tax=Rhizobium wenxiniae TaxID=1737357 RepID=UPI003C2836BD
MNIQATQRRQIRPPTIDELVASARYETLEDIVHKVFDDMEPSNRMTVTEAAVEYTKLGSGGGYSKPWSLDKTPYLQEPQDEMTSLDFVGCIFLGPARTGKTMMVLNLTSHTVKTDPTDMLFVHMDRENARKWSNGDFGRYLMASTAIRDEQLTSRQHDNTFDKTFKSGMRALITYPTPANLSGITVRIGVAIDYDRCEDDIGGEGNLFDLLSMRGTTHKRFAMTVAESSPNPNKEIKDPRWMPKTLHEAPPIRGIFELYNRGDRRRWQWCCPHCDNWFEPDFKHLHWGDHEDPMDARDATVMICPTSGCIIEPYQKDELNRHGRWIKEGEMIEPGLAGKTVIRPGYRVTRSSIASFWLKGPAAAYQEWGQLVEKFLRAKKALEETGDDGPLRKTVTTDQGSYYISQARLSDINPDFLKQKAEDWGSTEDEPVVPFGVRFLVATIDIQKMAFVVQVQGFTADGDHIVVDMFKVRLSNRRNANNERLPIDPAAYAEDWDVLKTEVMDRTYALADGSGRKMRIRATASDTGGAEGVTGHAYNFWRRLKAEQDGSHRRFILIKGEPSRSAPEAQTRWPDSSKKDKYAVARGDVPVVFFNSDKLKDRVSLLMSRRVAEEESRGGMLRYPDWAQDWFYVQLTSEVRTDKGWDNTRKRRNEAFDLSYYAQGVVLRPIEQRVGYIHFGYDRIDWKNPPAWAAEWDENDLVFGGQKEDQTEVSVKKTGVDALKALGERMG